MKKAIVVVAILLWPLLASAQEATADREPGVAIICGWHMYLGLQAVSDTCFAGRDAAFKAHLKASIERMEAFIMANAPMSREAVDRERKQRLAQSFYWTANMCKEKGATRFYENARRLDLNTLQAEIDRLLAVPLKPVSGPCP